MKKTTTNKAKIIKVKNAEGDLDTQAEVVIRNQIDYTPKVSVIIPVYNVEKYLKKCLDSVVNQTLKEIEIICVDDGSTDNSLKILKQYAKKDKRITVIKQKNGGLSAARNTGLNKCTAELVYFIDSDDYASNDALRILYTLLKKDHSDVSIGGVKCFGNIDNKLIMEKQNFFNRYAKSGKYFIDVDVRKNIVSTAWNKLYKMSVIKQFNLRFPEGLVHEDEYWLWAYMIHCRTYSVTEEILYYYLQRDNSIIGTKDFSGKVMDIIDINCLIYNEIKKYKDINQYKHILAYIFKNQASGALVNLPEKYFLQYLGKIKNYIKLNPSQDLINFYQRQTLKIFGSKKSLTTKIQLFLHYVAIPYAGFPYFLWKIRNLNNKRTSNTNAKVVAQNDINYVPKISVIIPVYNTEKFLRECLNSVICQTLKEIEIICVDDGSTDASLEILKKYAKKDRRITVVKQQNMKQGAARNNALKLARGKYVLFVDSDDYIKSNAAEKIYNTMKKNSLDMLSFIIDNFDNKTKKFHNDPYYQFKFLPKDFNYKKFNWLDAVNFLHRMPETCAVTSYSREFINSNNLTFPEKLFFEDNIFFAKAATKAKFMGILKKMLYCRRIHDKSTTQTWDKSFGDLLKADDIRLTYLKQFNYRLYTAFRKKCVSVWNLRYELCSKSCKEKYAPTLAKLLKKYSKNWELKAYICFPYYWFMRRKLKKHMNCLNSCSYRLITNTKIIPNKIVFNNFNGNGYGCSPKYIAEEIIKQNLPYKLVWLVDDVKKRKAEFPAKIKLVQYSVENAIKEFASAKIWISNQRMPKLYENGLFKKKNQYYIQTWHGAALKQIEKDVEKEKKWWCKWAKVDSEYIDYLLTAGKQESKLFKHNFYFKKEISDRGLPRDVIFFYPESAKNKIRENVYEKLDILPQKHIVLYAPTFRDDGRTDAYNLDCKKVLKSLKSKFSNDYTLLVRLHPNVNQKAESLIDFSKDIIDVTFYPDIQELLLCTDTLITDYSSCMFDFMLTGNSVFLYMPDVEEYKKERNFYIDFSDLPFPIATDNDGLAQNIKTFDSANYKLALRAFIQKRGYAQGNAIISDVLDKIKTHIGK